MTMNDEHWEHWEEHSNSLPDTYFTAYDRLKFPRRIAERLVSLTGLLPGQNVLDVACGTGWVTMAAARAVGESGRVVGIDVEDNWLDIARKKAKSAGLSNIEYRQGNAQALDFDDGSFDVVTCASSIMLFEDVPGALRECCRVLKTGGTLALTSFGPRLLQPVLKPLGECLSRYDGQPPAVPFFVESTDSPEKCRGLLQNAGFGKIEIATEDMGYSFPDTAAYWREISLTFVGIRMARLGPADLERLKAEHLAEIELWAASQRLFIEVPTHFSIARKYE
jgi:ubiquinone/menaquinone biosynthesis C-methylase UbiE